MNDTDEPMPESESIIDILAIAAHRDDVEQTCAGTLLRMQSLGLKTGILDLTRGEGGTRGTAEDRGREAAEAARILGVTWREALDLPDGRVENTYENRIKIVRVLRHLQPRVVILPYWQGRHPDHYTASTLGYQACFVAGLAKVETGTAPYRPFKILYASLYADVRPTFVVDITDSMPIRIAVEHCSCRRKRFGSGLSHWLAITVCWEGSAMQSHLCRRKSAWWMI
jgi:bacillithiol biosynthesis deacetylase BshB1